MLTLSSPLADLKGVGKTLNGRLKKLGLETVQDLLFYFPFRYDEYSPAGNISHLQEGQESQIIGVVDLIQNKRARHRRLTLTEALIQDESGTLKVIWFNQPFIAKNLQSGDYVSLAGKVTEQFGQLTMISPVYEKITNPQENINATLHHTKGIIPNYHLSSGLTSKQLRFLISQILPLSRNLTDSLPNSIIKYFSLINLEAAIKSIHFPNNQEELQLAQKRLAFEELFLRQLKAQYIKNQLRLRQAIKIPFLEAATQDFVAKLPFSLTISQKKSAWEIIQDLQKDQPMSRLLEGDVGSGKTIVAALGILNVLLSQKGQVLLMAPTEILASQHFTTFQELFKNYPFKIGLLTSGRKETNFIQNKKITTSEIIRESELLIGTHALIQEKIILEKTALAIVDEQHRFGVRARQKLLGSKKSLTPHFLSLSATPIPRSLALALCGDLNLSIIDEMPAGRLPVLTKIVEEEKRAAAYQFTTEEINKGRQAFVICPLIDPSDKSETKSVKEEVERLKKVFPNFSIGLLHGRLKSKEKEKVMADFLAKKNQILVSTSVIEVGMDIKNASIMIIEGAERFGLATLHQFRGRVGRGDHQSYCFLFLGEEKGEKAKQRLKSLVKYSRGVNLAEEDLKMRGSGEAYGLVQSGFPELKIASLFNYEIIKKAGEAAASLLRQDPELTSFPLLKNRLGKLDEKAHLE